MAIENYKRIHNVVGNMIDVVFVSGTDFGMQQGLFMCKYDYRDLFMPFYKRVNSWIHESTKWNVLYIHVVLYMSFCLI